MTADELLKHWLLLTVRELPDGTMAGIQRLITTWSLVLDIDPDGWRYRFCYAELSDALDDFEKLQGVRDVPNGPWVACRPEVRVRDETTGLPRYPTPDELRALRGAYAPR